MHVSTETTIADIEALAPEKHKQIIGGIAEQRQRQHDELMQSLGRRGVAKPPRFYRGRQVLIPGKRKAARHPWADRLEAARTGGFVIDQTHPDSNVIVGSCYGCGHRFGFVAGDPVGESEFEREVQRHQDNENGARECMTGVTL